MIRNSFKKNYLTIKLNIKYTYTCNKIVEKL